MEEVDTHYEIAYPPKVGARRRAFPENRGEAGAARLARGNPQRLFRGARYRRPSRDPRRNGRIESARHPASAARLRLPLAGLSFPRRRRQGAVCHRLRDADLQSDRDARGNRAQAPLHASLLALVKNAQGQIVERVSKDVPSEVSDDRLAAVQVEFMTYQHAVNLPPGHYTVEAAVVDHEGNRASTSVIADRQSGAAGSGPQRPDAGAAAGELSTGRRTPRTRSSSQASGCSRL